jgi:YggT family protein
LLLGGGCIGESIGSQIVCLLAYVLVVAIFARAILSWFNLDPRSPLIQMLDSLTEPILDPIRRIMPRLGMIDLSPLVAILLLQLISQGVQQALG